MTKISWATASDKSSSCRNPGLKSWNIGAYRYRVPGTGRIVGASFPCDVKAPVQYGVNFKSFLLYLSEYQLLPQQRISQLCLDLFGYGISEATLAQAREQCHQNLVPFQKALRERLQASQILHADESGVRVEGKLHWMHSLSGSSPMG